MLKKLKVIVLLLMFALTQLPAQEEGVTRYGDNMRMNAAFVNHFGESVLFPRLSSYGHILCYSPIVTLNSVNVSVANSVKLYGSVLFDGWSPVTMRGFDYSYTPDFSDFIRHICTGTSGPFSSDVDGLEYNRDYYVRSFATNDYGTSFSDTIPFTIAVGPVIIDTLVQASQTPYASELELSIAENGGRPLSGEITVFLDPDHSVPLIQNDIAGLSAHSVESLVEGLSPSTLYYVRAVLSNGLYSDTAYLQIKTPTDLTLSIESSGDAEVSLCQGGTSVSYRAILSGTDANKPLYQFVWAVSSGTVSVNDTTCTVLFNEAGSSDISVRAFYLEDTLFADFVQTVNPRVGNASFYVCTNEFLNTAEATTTGISSIRWLDEGNNVVATDNSVKLPTGYYTVECRDPYGCVLSEEVYVGKKKLFCTVTDEPASHESARFEDGVWKIDSISDIDGNWYAVTQIGSLCWIRQNLRTRHLPSTGQDLLGTGNGFTPNMLYSNKSVICDPDDVINDGGLYTWCAALDYEMASYGSVYVSPPRRQGLCPAGWHIPSKNEVIEVVDSMLNLCCEGMDIIPTLDTWSEDRPQYSAAENTPIKYMFLKSCYASYANPPYPEEIYDATNLSLLSKAPHGKFWLVDSPLTTMTTFSLNIDSYEGIKIGVALRNATYLPVRCVRDY